MQSKPRLRPAMRKRDADRNGVGVRGDGLEAFAGLHVPYSHCLIK
eukprot:SAG31_NODE_38080_length_299_cov_0.770000_1_plen_44_part_01